MPLAGFCKGLVGVHPNILWGGGPSHTTYDQKHCSFQKTLSYAAFFLVASSFFCA